MARWLDPQWNKTMIVASIAISFLGAFTSTQLMCHARMSLHFSSVLIWSLAGSVIFGFCSIWSLHEVAMLAYELDIPIGVDPGLTILSSILAVLFTFLALSHELLWDRWQKRHQRRLSKARRHASKPRHQGYSLSRRRNSQGTTPLLGTPEDIQDDVDDDVENPGLQEQQEEDYFSRRTISQSDGPGNDLLEPNFPRSGPSTPSFEGMALADRIERSSIDSRRSNEPRKPVNGSVNGSVNRLAAPIDVHDDPDEDEAEGEDEGISEAQTATTSEYTYFPRRSSNTTGYLSSGGFGSALGMMYTKSGLPARNAFAATASLLYKNFTLRNIGKGFLWSLAITNMHYCGMKSLKVPQGGMQFSWPLVLLSAVLSWVTCTVGCILMSQMETQLSQQLLFSAIASAGVAAMHFTGMRATRFWSTAAPSNKAGYPPELASSVVAIAFITCIAANVLLAHSATVSRNKLAEIVWTRKELWRAIAQRENAEAAAKARSDFIASASHEIRTPLHHLTGYADLLAQTELTSEGRDLLTAIQRATKTLSLITNNVLDWSKFEREEGAYRPVALDLRSVCESVVVLLPNFDEDSRVELYVVVSPDVPKTVFLDETFIHRILMNLLSNALKFTRFGYILLSIDLEADNLVAKVTDTGCGLEPSFIPEMWTPFKQGEVRGSAPGTGIGLSIISQLLKRMKGSIDVESKYMHSEGVGPGKSGTTFKVTIPLGSTILRAVVPRAATRPMVALLSVAQNRANEGLIRCWETFGYDVERVVNAEELGQGDWKYVWVDLEFLNLNLAQFETLLRKVSLTVLVPYDTHDSLEGLPGILSAPNFVMLPKPLIWHTYEKRMASKKQQIREAAPTQALRFATEVEVLNEEHRTDTLPLTSPKIKQTVLLVEDNLINQRLGVRMLTSLGHDVITASDGQEAIDLLLKNNIASTVDIILMDQSMPKVDGVTATREIRGLEALGKIVSPVPRRPIIAVTAVVNSESQAYFKDAGAEDFLAKPLSLDKLKETISIYLPR